MSARKSAFYMLFLLLYSLVSPDALADGFSGTALPLWAVPTAPTGVTVYPSSTALTIDFVPPASDGSITNYEYSLDGGTTWNACSPATTKNPVTVTGLTTCSNYQVAIRAVNASGAGAASTPIDAALTNGTLAGTSWTSGSTTGSNLRNVAFGNGVYIAVSYNGGNFVKSTDGMTWTSISVNPVGESNQWYGITYGEGLFVAVGQGLNNTTGSPGKRIITSNDNGVTWVVRDVPVNNTALNSWQSVTYGNGMFVAVSNHDRGSGSGAMYSYDGITWSLGVGAPGSNGTPNGGSGWQTVTYGNGKFVAVSNNISTPPAANCMVSTDGVNWTTSGVSISVQKWLSVTFGNGKFVAVSQNQTSPTVIVSRYATSTDGLTWTDAAMPVDNPWFSIAYGNGLFVVVSSGGSTGNRAMSSPDGVTWTTGTSIPNQNWNSVCFGNGKFVATNSGGAASMVSSFSATTTSAPIISSMTASGSTSSVAFTTPLIKPSSSSITNYEYSKDNGSTWTALSPVATTSPINIGAVSSGALVKLRSVTSPTASNCASAAFTFVETHNWIGGSGNWNQASNWSLSSVPSGSTHITISSGTPNLDVDFTLSSGRSLALSGTGSLVIAAGKTLTIAGTADFGGKSVILKSTADGTAAIGQITGTVSNATNVTVERYIPTASRGWRFLTIPVTSSSSIRSQWAGANANAAAPAGETAGTGTLITGHRYATGAAAAAAGFDWFNGLTATSNSSIRFYDGVNDNWSSATATPDITAAPSKQAYMLYIRGDRTVSNGTGSSVTTLKPVGELKKGTQSIAISNFYEPIGNPYPAALDLDAVYANTGNSTVIERNFWVWDATLGTAGGFRAISYGTSSYSMTGGTGNVSDYLKVQSGQAFFVQRKTTGNLTIQESNKVGGPTPVVFGIANPPVEADGQLHLNLARNGRQLDGSLLRFNNVYKANTAEQYDVPKMNNFNENLSFVNGNEYLSIESRPFPVTKDTVQLAFWNLTPGNYSLLINSFNLEQKIGTAVLMDQFTNTATALNLTNDSTSFQFSVTANAASSSLNRFAFVFSAPIRKPVEIIGLSADANATGIYLKWKTAKEPEVKFFEVERSTNGIEYVKIATVAANAFANEASYISSDAFPVFGTNWYRIRAIELSGASTYSSVIKRDWSKNAGVELLSSLASNGRIALLLRDQPIGNYQASVFASNGTRLFTKEIRHSQSSARYDLQLTLGAAPLQKGMYFLELSRGPWKKGFKLWME